MGLSDRNVEKKSYIKFHVYLNPRENVKITTTKNKLGYRARRGTLNRGQQGHYESRADISTGVGAGAVRGESHIAIRIILCKDWTASGETGKK